MRVLLVGAALVLATWVAHAQSTDASAPDPSSPVRIQGIAINKSVVDAFLRTLSTINDEATNPVPTSPDKVEDLECGSDQDPFGDLITGIPPSRLETIVQEHGFDNVKHWQRIGQKLVAMSAIQQMQREQQISGEDMQIDVGDVFSSD